MIPRGPPSWPCLVGLHSQKMEKPDASTVVENPDYEFDEFVEEKDSISRPELQAAHDELSAAECREMSLFMYSNLQHQANLYLAFKNSLALLTSGSVLPL